VLFRSIYLSGLFKKHNFELRIAGGAVRDLLMEIEPNDVDLATDAMPNQMLDLFQREQIRIFNLKGLKHGTVAIRINDKSNFEITTLRIDVKTYGRHAEVEFTNDWHKDAIRRDLTVNSLFLDFTGQVIDYVNGVEDLKNRIIKFVGIPDKRVKEDYLRILRYFRFYSRVCLTPDNHDELSLKAIRDNVEGLRLISGERIGYELRKILSQKFSDSFMKLFYEYGIAKFIGLPNDGDLKNYSSVYNNCFKYKPEPMTLLNSLIKNNGDVAQLDKTIKLSREEKYLLNALQQHSSKITRMQSNNQIVNYFKKQLTHPKSNLDRSLKKSEAIEVLKYTNLPNLIDEINELILPSFPIAYADLMSYSLYDHTTKQTRAIETYLKSGKLKYNQLLKDLKLKWIDSDFKLTKHDLLSLIDQQFLEQYIPKSKKLKANKN